MPQSQRRTTASQANAAARRQRNRETRAKADQQAADDLGITVEELRDRRFQECEPLRKANPDRVVNVSSLYDWQPRKREPKKGFTS